MFDELVATAVTARGAGAVGAWARLETTACARRLQAMVAMLDARRAAAGFAEREQWYLDNWGAVAAEIGAAQHITSHAASNQLLLATALRDRLPRVAASFARGHGSYGLMSTIVWRTALIENADAMRKVDTAIAAALEDWEPRSEAKTVAAIDAWVAAADPKAVRRGQSAARGRHVQIRVDGDGMASLWGTLFAHDAEAFDARLNTLAATVCADDPRTVKQRRADAFGALSTGADRLACLCGAQNCLAATAPAPSSTVVYVIAHQDTLDDDSDEAVQQDAGLDGEAAASPSPRPLRQMTLVEALADTEPPTVSATRPGQMVRGPFLPGPVIRRAALNAAVRRVFHPGGAPPESRYVPSRALADFVRCRDLTCRFPGCDVPATDCDLDHTIAYPGGPTQASNLKCLCRFHHLLKTFWPWRDRQLPDGTVVWVSPSGAHFTTRPGSRLLFPSLCLPTATVTTRAGRPAINGGLKMPRRDRTRAEDRRQRIDDERRLNGRDRGERAGRRVLAM
jgi:hypothetical protein